MNYVWKMGDVVAWRGIYRNRIWHVQPTLLVQDRPEEIVSALLPGTECIADEDYPRGKQNGKRRWHFKDREWRLANYIWRTNRLLLIHESGKYFSTILFWNDESSEFLCYYINFQLPFQRSHCGIDTLDLELDLVINPDFTYRWKDLEDYQAAIRHEVILPEWRQGIEMAKEEIFGRLEKRLYPFDGAWLDWRPAPDWTPPTLPANWDKI
jgi:protein associated with RNAse G/E